ATAPSMGALVRTVAGERARLQVLIGPDRDLHAVAVQPSMIRALRDADLVVAIGAELEVGWLPPAIASAANPAILPGRDGYFEAAAQVPLLDVGAPADRALGDVHPAGNPHVNMDPVRMATIAAALAERLARLDPAGAARYRANAADFRAAVMRQVAVWERQLANAPGVVLYHRDAVYLLDRFGVPLLGTIEPVPGVPPSGRHLSHLIGDLRGHAGAGAGLVIYAPYQSPRAPRRVADALGWPLVRLSLEPPLGSGGAGYLRHLGEWVEAIAGATASAPATSPVRFRLAALTAD
ncbi:MAG: zinc ABC transporter substrate-binding protein, partial [Chromatiaceae bacterium]